MAASNRLYSRRPLAERWAERVRRSDGCWEWTGRRAVNGYGTMSISLSDRGGKYVPVSAHRISWQLAFGPIPAGKYVLHHCDNKGCVRPEHLYLGSPLDNMRDRSERGRAPKGANHPLTRHPERAARGDGHGARLHPERVARGERHGNSVVSDADALTIRASTERGVVLAARYGISPTTVSRIRTGKIRRHL